MAHLHKYDFTVFSTWNPVVYDILHFFWTVIVKEIGLNRRPYGNTIWTETVQILFQESVIYGIERSDYRHFSPPSVF